MVLLLKFSYIFKPPILGTTLYDSTPQKDPPLVESTSRLVYACEKVGWASEQRATNDNNKLLSGSLKLNLENQKFLRNAWNKED